MQFIVLREKHGDFYYDASDDETFALAALKILTDRWNDGYWYHDPVAGRESTRQWRPECLMDHFIPGFYELGDELESERQAAITKWRTDLEERYPDDPEYRAIKIGQLKVAIEEYKRDREYEKWYAETKRIVEEQDASFIEFRNGHKSPRAWQQLSARDDHEYEGVDLEEARDPRD